MSKVLLTDLTRDDLLALDPSLIKHRLSEEEFFHLFVKMDAFWSFAKGNPYHAKLKSGLCSNGFFFSKIVLQYPNLCRLLANQLVLRYLTSGLAAPDIVFGIPDGATVLGDMVAEGLGSETGKMSKVMGKLQLNQQLKPGQTVLFVEDFCTRGTAFLEAEWLLIKAQQEVNIIPFELALLNRGGLRFLEGQRAAYGISAIVTHQIDDFEFGAETCPMCKEGSKPIRPKETEENWALINYFNREGVCHAG